MGAAPQTEQQQYEKAVAETYDFTAGTLKTTISAGAGTVVGGLAATATASTGVGAPAAPYVGIVAGTGADIGTNYLLGKYVFEPLRPYAIEAGTAVYPYYSTAVNYNSEHIIAPIMSAIGK